MCVYINVSVYIYIYIYLILDVLEILLSSNLSDLVVNSWKILFHSDPTYFRPRNVHASTAWNIITEALSDIPAYLRWPSVCL